jgi:hypothetical protein
MLAAFGLLPESGSADPGENDVRRETALGVWIGDQSGGEEAPFSGIGKKREIKKKLFYNMCKLTVMI